MKLRIIARIQHTLIKYLVFFFPSPSKEIDIFYGGYGLVLVVGLRSLLPTNTCTFFPSPTKIHSRLG